jgi:hypothetical protein
MEKKLVLREINIDTSMFMTSFEKASELLIKEKQRLEEEGWSNIHLKHNMSYDSSEIVAMGMRLESDDEFKKRRVSEGLKEKAKARREKAREKAELKKYKELKKKYES